MAERNQPIQNHFIQFILLLLLPAILMAACSKDDDTIPGFKVIEENGIPVAITAPGSNYQAPIFRFEPVVTMKEDPSREESLLSRPSPQFYIGSNDHYFVPDYRANDIAVYDSDGIFLDRFGRQGDGPGEFRAIRLQSILDNEITIFDFQHQRTTFYDLNGVLIEVIHSPVGGMIIGMERGPGGTFLLHGVVGRDEGNIGYSSRTMTIVTADGDTISHVSTVQVMNNMLTRIEVSPGSFSTLSQDIPYAANPSILHLPGRGLLAYDGETSELTWYDYQGNVTMVISTGLQRRPITASVRSRFIERQRQARAKRARERGTDPQPLPDYPFPEFSGFFEWGMIDDEGWVWLTDVWASREDSDEDGYTFHVISDEGRYMGTAELPDDRFNIQQGKVMCVVEDPETGALVPTVFKIVSNADGMIYP